jgi:hypothetical protein
MIRNLLILLLVFTPAAFGQAKTLYWRNMTVNALLDADGRLHLEERQSMVFNGNWNGGERVFRVSLGQELKLESLSRVDPATGQERELSRGDLSEVDQYKWAGSNTLRWRSRLPEDPPFDNAEITYVLRYTLSNILKIEGGHYLLDHDFVFPQRSGMIQQLNLSLELDPVWKPLKRFAGVAEAGPIPPGESFLVTLPMEYQGTGKPAAVLAPAAPWARYLMFLVLAAAIASILCLFYRRENALGRFKPLIPPSSIDRAWVEDNILQFSPELVGTIWDESVGAAEVAAVLARLVMEGKLQSEVKARQIEGFRRASPEDPGSERPCRL